MKWAILILVAAAVGWGSGLADAGDSTPPSGGAAPGATQPTPAPAPDCFRAAGRHKVAGENVYIPRKLPANPPLILAFHGLRESPEALEQQIQLDPVADRSGFVVAYPTARGGSLSWHLNHREGDEDVDYIEGFIDQAVAKLCADPKRVYLTGFSNGASFTWRASCDLAGKVAAVAPVSGSYKLQDDCPSGTPGMPTIEIHGNDPWAGTAVRMLEATKARNDCTRHSVSKRMAVGVSLTVWPGCNIEHVYNKGIGHEWQTSGSYNTGVVVWRFVSRFSR